jgi:hypothetical protein
VTSTSTFVDDLAPGNTYTWFVVARAGCNPTLTRESAVSSFSTRGACLAPGSLEQQEPKAAATDVPAKTTLKWTTSANASVYDVYLGTNPTPPLYQANVTGTSLPISGLEPGQTYYWRVLARSGCSSATYPSIVLPFRVTAACATPAAPEIVFVPPGKVSVGSTYVIVWSNVGLDPDGEYLVERATDSGFSTLVDSQVVSGTSATFTASAAVSYHHRVKAMAGCGRESAHGVDRVVEGDLGKPSVIFTKPPEAVLTLVGTPGSSIDSLVEEADPGRRLRTFTIENTSNKDLRVVVLPISISPAPIFVQIEDPSGAPVYPDILLRPREPRKLLIRFSNVSPTQTGSYDGIVYLSVQGGGQEVVPWAFVNLKVGGGSAVAPEFLAGGGKTEHAFLSPFSTGKDDQDRPPLVLDIRNPGTTQMELGIEIGPEVWLEPEAGWNKTPIPPGGTRPLKLFSRRGRALEGSALPRYTYVLLRTKEGATTRLAVQDNDQPVTSSAPRTFLEAGAKSFIVPSVVNAASKTGGSFVSRVRLTNTGSEDVAAELIFTPHDTDGFDSSAVRRVTVVVPKRDVVALTDPLITVFGLDKGNYGPLEVRAPQDRVGFLSVAAAVEAPSQSGGAFGFQLPTLGRGEGASLGQTHTIVGITAGADYRTNLLLVETTGRGTVTVRITLWDAEGRVRGEEIKEIPRYGLRQYAVDSLPGGSGLGNGRIDLTVTGGDGVVTGVVTVIDNLSSDAVTYKSKPTEATAALKAQAKVEGRMGVLSTAQATNLIRVVVPSVVTGFSAYRDQPDSPYKFRSRVVLGSGTAQPATFDLTFRSATGAPAKTARVEVAARGTHVIENVLEDVFGVPKGTKAYGTLSVDASPNGHVQCKVFSNAPEGTLGDSFPIFTIGDVGATGGASDRRVLTADSLEQSIDLARGTRSNLILNEVLGQPVRVRIRLYEAGNRTYPIAQKDVDLPAFGFQQLSTVFEQLGLGDKDGQTRLKDRTNALCTVEAIGGEGLAIATITLIDNKTADTKNFSLQPAGPPQGGTIGF